MAVNKVVYNTEDGAQTLIDLTSDSVTPETLAKGATAHDASGNVIIGTLDVADDSAIGTWVFNDEVFCDQGYWYSFKFHTAEKSYDGMYLDIDFIDHFTGDFSASNYQAETAYDGYTDGWQGEHYKTITITEEPTDEDFITWLKANAKKQGTEVESSNFEMPIIRFANFQDTDGSMCLTETNTFKFTVEILGGGALREGDLLQICVRRKYKWGGERSKWKLRQVAQRYIESEDIGKRFLSIDVGLGDVERGFWLFRNDRNRKYSAPSGESIDTLSYMYFRIKRVTKYSDESRTQERDAIFSNIEKVAKTYICVENKLTIK